MLQINLLQIDLTTLNSMPPVYGVPQYFALGGNGQIKIWPQPSNALLATGLRITFDLSSSDPTALTATP